MSRTARVLSGALLSTVLLSSVLVAGCSTPPVASAPASLWRDAEFRPPTQVIDPAAAFALSDELRTFIHQELVPRMRVGDGRQRVLVEALHQRGRMRLDYDASVTRTASEAFASRTGNCLSLVLLTAAVAKEVGLRVTYNRAVVDETWSRSGDLYFLNGHVNVTLGRRLGDDHQRVDSEHWVMVDFLPPEELAGLRTVPVDERTVVAMFLNNRAAEALARSELHDAYWWARAAVLQDPGFAPGYNTLGVVYLRRGDAPAAEQALRHALAKEPGGRQALANLVLVLRQQGRAAEADDAARRLAALEDRPPFHHFQLGLAAAREGRWRTARDLFEAELKRQPDSHEAHYWAGRASLALGDMPRARNHLTQALLNGTTRTDRGLYAAKLQALEGRTDNRVR